MYELVDAYIWKSHGRHGVLYVVVWHLYSSLSSRLQAILLFEAYELRTSNLGMIRTAVGHHYKFEFVLPPGLEPGRLRVRPAC